MAGFSFILSSTTMRRKFQSGLKMSVIVNKFGRLFQHFTSSLALLGLRPDHRDFQFLFLSNPTGVFFSRNEGNCCILKPACSKAQADVKPTQGFPKPTSMNVGTCLAEPMRHNRNKQEPWMGHGYGYRPRRLECSLRPLESLSDLAQTLAHMALISSAPAALSTSLVIPFIFFA